MRRIGRVAVVGVVLAALLTGCAASESAKDASGVTREETQMMSLREQYVLAGMRYVELNDRVAELQRGIFQDGWKDSATRSEVIPGSGFTHGGELEGDERGESYYFPVSRWHAIEGDAKTLLTRAAKDWSAKGWDVGREKSSYNGEERITATTPDGFWFELSEEGDNIGLTGFSPVYWGDELKIIMAIGARRDAEDAAGLSWESEHPTTEGRMTLLPGVYRPFPAWDAVEAE